MLWVGPGLLSPSQEEEQRVAVRDEGDTGGGVISVWCFQGDRENASVRQAPGVAPCLGTKGPSGGARVV